jgi:putative tricarboxylic transport membrane protein
VAENFNLLAQGILTSLQPYNFMIAMIGLVLGVIVGVLPGLGGANGVAILIPLTVSMQPISGIILLASIYWGALYGGSITSILFNIPGEPWSVATTFDGYPLAKQGKAGKALVLSFFSHFVGAVIGVIMLSFFAPIIAEFALRFGPAEIFAVMTLTFSAFVGLGGKDAMKTCTSIFIGFILASVGMDTVTGQLRMTYGSIDLMGGFNFIVAVIGLFGLGEIFLTVEEGLKLEGATGGSISFKDMKEGILDIAKNWKALLLGCVVGCWMGLKPGGATPASFMAYGFAKQSSKNKDEFGKGASAGIIAPEAAAHGAGTSAALPMITLGIPGSPTMAVIMGGLMIFGLVPGPMLFKENPVFVWGFIGSCWIGNLLGLFIVLAFSPLFAAILKIRFSIIMPIIVYVCAIGAYAVNNRMIDIYYMIIFGVLGYLFKKLDYPLAPMVLALVLGDMAESALRQALLISGGNPLVLVKPPIALPLMVAASIIFFWPSISEFLKKRKQKSSVGPG